jgi:glycine/D-amino acid oxidase-like deaminating enzyme
VIRRAERSWWMEEALADPALEGEPTPPLDRDVTADVVVLGGGYTGMWTAWFLKEREPELDVVLLERDVCGGGPSGRNGGFCNGFWEDIEILVELFGVARALEVCHAAERSVEEIGAWCTDHDVDAWYTAAGHLGVATSAAQEGAWDDWYALMVRLAVEDGRIEPLTPDQVAERCRSPLFGAGVLTTNVATLQPARLARGLRRELLRTGVHIFEGTPVLRFRGGSSPVVETPGGLVRAGRAVLGMGAYMAPLPRFRRTIVPRGTYIVLTEPVPDRLEAIGWTGGEGIYDFRTALRYLRTTRDGRVAFGAATAVAGLGVGLGPRLDFDERSVVDIARDLARMFPTLADARLECAWGGPIDVTGCHVPSFGTLPGGRAHFGVGYTGGGVGPCHLGGRILSGLALDADDEVTRLPLVGLEPKRLPPEPLRSPGVAIVQRAILAKDEAEDRGRRPNPVVDLVARLPRRLGYHLGP